MGKFIDLTGKRFENWLVIEKAPKTKVKIEWLCECQCEKKTRKIIVGSDLKRGGIKSCGCLNKSAPLDLIGKKFWKLTVIERVENTKKGKSRFKCICECGNKKEVIAVGSKIVSGLTKSCGCFKADLIMKRSKTHGERRTRLYSIWSHMKTRCTNEKEPGYKYYGGRGIKFCKEWEDYIVFKNWANKNGYEEHLTLERNDVNGNYEPSNCSWVTQQEQVKNTRRNVRFTYKGKTMIMAEWARYFGVCNSTIREHRLKGTLEQAFERWEKKLKENN